MYCRSVNSVGGFHANNPNLTSSIHDHQNPLSPSTNSSFHKKKFPSLLSKSNHLTNLCLSSEKVLATPLPFLFHHSPSLSPIPPSKSPVLLLVGFCRNTWDPIGALGHPVGSIRASCRMTCCGLFWGWFVEKVSRKIGEDLYFPPKPSNLLSPSLTHLLHHQEYLAFTFLQKRKKRKKELLCSFKFTTIECLVISDCMPRTIRITHMLA